MRYAVTRITDLQTFNLRFPTSQHLDGSDAMNPDPNYSAAYVVLKTDNPDLAGHGLTPSRSGAATTSAVLP
jgi:L-fuconate dehydratase